MINISYRAITVHLDVVSKPTLASHQAIIRVDSVFWLALASNCVSPYVLEAGQPYRFQLQRQKLLVVWQVEPFSAGDR